jgi:hypothetical protein
LLLVYPLPSNGLLVYGAIPTHWTMF